MQSAVAPLRVTTALARAAGRAAAPAAAFGDLVLRPLYGMLPLLDAGRGLTLRILVKILGSAAAPFLTRPSLRIAALGSLAVAVGLGLSLAAPLWLLAVSPLVLGVPHLLGDLRYLVARPGCHRRTRLVLLAGVPLLVCGLGAGMPAGLLAVAGAMLAARGEGFFRRGLGLLACAAVGLVGYRYGFYYLELALAHVHNFVGVLLLWLWRPRREVWPLVPLVLVLVGSALILLGVAEPAAWALSLGPRSPELGAGALQGLLAPAGLFDPTLGLRLVLVYAFAQSVHYAVWLRLIPEDDRERPAPRSFSSSLRALRADLGGPLLAGALIVFVGLALWALRDLAAARTGYFRVALFHGYLELCALGLWLVEGRPARPRKLASGAALGSGAATAL